MAKLKKYLIALNLPLIVAKLIVLGRSIILAMTNNSWFPSPPIVLAVLAAHLDALEAAEARVVKGDKTTTATRNLAQKQVEDDLQMLAAYVRGIAAQNPGQEVVIINSSGFSQKRYTRPQKAPIQAQMGATPGEVVVKAKSRGRGAAYEWQYSSDGGKTWVAMGTTTVADTSLTGLSLGATYLFRFRSTLRKATGDWSEPTSILVH